MIIIYVDIILLAILFCLMLFTCGYCFYRVHSMQQAGEITLLLKPKNVMFSHKKEEDGTEELRTVVAYQNPFTGDYCVRKSRTSPKGYMNQLEDPETPDSGLSDEYEPLHAAPSPSHLRPRIPGQETPGQPEHKDVRPWCSGEEDDWPLGSLPEDIENAQTLKSPDQYYKQNGIIHKNADVKIVVSPTPENSVTKSWNWHYEEYQI